MKILKNISQIILTILTFVLIPMVVFTLVTSNSSLLGGFRSFVVLSGSMQPLIPVGSIIYTLKNKDYQRGDIISFEKGKQVVTHRIVEVQDEQGKVVSPLVSPVGYKKPSSIFYKTQGDANKASDQQLIPQNQVIGQAFLLFPFVGRLVMFLKTILGFLLLLVLPTFIFIGFELWGIKKEVEKNMERKFLERMRLS